MSTINHIQAGEVRFTKKSDSYELYLSMPKIGKTSLMLRDPETLEYDYMWTGLDYGTSPEVLNEDK
jgi:hypothetical protein